MREVTLGSVVASARVIDRTMGLATLRPGEEAEPYYDEILVEFGPDGVRTPAGSTSSSLATYCTGTADLFERLETVDDRRLTAVFDIAEFTAWLRWVDDGSPVEIEFLGDPDDDVISAFRLTAGDLTAVVDCYRDPELIESLTFELPKRFTDDDRFILESGEPAPVRVETTAATMRRIADAVSLSPTVDYHPFRVADGELRLALERRTGPRAFGRLSGTVEPGPDVHNEYDEGFAQVFRCLSGDVELQTGPDQPLVVVQRAEAYTLRYVIMPVVW